VLVQLRPHLLGATNFSEYQSGYRTGHSTETALLEVLDSVYTAADDKQLSVIIGLVLSVLGSLNYHTGPHQPTGPKIILTLRQIRDCGTNPKPKARWGLVQCFDLLVIFG